MEKDQKYWKMRIFGLSLVVLSLVLVADGCNSQQQAPTPATTSSPEATASPAAPAAVDNTAPATAGGRKDPCKLLTSGELQAVQGEALKDTKGTSRPEGGFFVSQCYFTLATLSKSVVLTVTAAGRGDGARNPKQYWRETFHRQGEVSGKEDRSREAEKGKGGENKERGDAETEQERTAPQRVSGLGDEAFWEPSRIGGALYVLKGDVFIRLSIGGPDNPETKMKKTQALAQKVLSRL
jgi:hypothetical protein